MPDINHFDFEPEKPDYDLLIVVACFVIGLLIGLFSDTFQHYHGL